MGKRFLSIVIVVMIALAIFADTPQVQNVTAKQRFPWNGLVDITCSVTGINGTTNGLEFAVAAVMPDSGDVRTSSYFWVVHNGTKTTDCRVQTNGNYHLLWDAQADLGLVIYSNMVVRVTTKVPNKVQLWAGGPYWGKVNIGAEVPWEYGYYFWWGDTVGYKWQNNAWMASDGSSSAFSFSEENVPTFDQTIDMMKSGGWLTVDNVLTPDHDAAHIQWGGRWRMPSRQELSGLNNNCDWTWATTNGVNGYVIRGRGDYAYASIFLPAAGSGSGPSLNDVGSRGNYWSSVPDSDMDVYDSWGLEFYSGVYRTSGYLYRSSGFPVRPVQGFTE